MIIIIVYGLVRLNNVNSKINEPYGRMNICPVTSVVTCTEHEIISQVQSPRLDSHQLTTTASSLTRHYPMKFWKLKKRHKDSNLCCPYVSSSAFTWSTQLPRTTCKWHRCNTNMKRARWQGGAACAGAKVCPISVFHQLTALQIQQDHDPPPRIAVRFCSTQWGGVYIFVVPFVSSSTHRGAIYLLVVLLSYLSLYRLFCFQCRSRLLVVSFFPPFSVARRVTLFVVSLSVLECIIYKAIHFPLVP